MKRKLFSGLLILAVAAGAFTMWRLEPRARVGSGHGSKLYGSGIFVSGRTPEAVRATDFDDRFDILSFSHDLAARSVHAGFPWLASASAYHRPGFGVTLLHHMTPEQLDAQLANVQLPTKTTPRWTANGSVPYFSKLKLEAALDREFSEPEADWQRGTRAVVVVKGGHIIAERYAPGFSADTPLVGWSMSKSVTSTLIGILADRGLLDVNAPAPIEAWREDERSQITLDQLLRMTSSLAWIERYDEGQSDVTAMLYASPDMTAYAVSRPLADSPGTQWKYSSGTSMILSRIVHESAEKAGEEPIGFPYRELFGPLGMHSALIELDNTGTFVGSSYMFASARDWARYGLLYLNRGMWNGKRILSEEWIDYSLTPTPESPNGKFGAHWWLNTGRKEWPSLAENVYAARGYQGQHVLVMPDEDLVIVRLGAAQPEKHYSIEPFVSDVLDALSP